MRASHWWSSWMDEMAKQAEGTEVNSNSTELHRREMNLKSHYAFNQTKTCSD
jgi:hypothetical protein